MLDQMNWLLKKLKEQFENNQEVDKEVFQQIMQKDFEGVIANVKEEYSTLFQSNRKHSLSSNGLS